MLTIRVFRHSVGAPNPALGLERVVGAVALSIRDWLMECLTR